MIFGRTGLFWSARTNSKPPMRGMLSSVTSTSNDAFASSSKAVCPLSQHVTECPLPESKSDNHSCSSGLSSAQMMRSFFDDPATGLERISSRDSPASISESRISSILFFQSITKGTISVIRAEPPIKNFTRPEFLSQISIARSSGGTETVNVPAVIACSSRAPFSAKICLKRAASSEGRDGLARRSIGSDRLAPIGILRCQSR